MPVRSFIFIFIFLFFCFLSFETKANTLPYTQACRTINEDDFVQYQLQTDLKNKFVISITAFEDENCQTPYLLIERSFEIESFKNENLNLKTEKISYTSLSDEVSQALNLSSYCGLKNWKTKIEQNVTGLKCDNYLQLKLGQAFYQILKADASSVWLGDDRSKKNGLSEALRPDTYDLVFQK